MRANNRINPIDVSSFMTRLLDQNGEAAPVPRHFYQHWRWRAQPALDVIERLRFDVVESQHFVTRLETCPMFATARSDCVDCEGARQRLPSHRLAAFRFRVGGIGSGLKLDRYCRSSTAHHHIDR